MSPKVWFVTGSSSGLGLAIVKYALSKGDMVAATLRKPEVLSELASKYEESQLLLVKLDVTNSDELASAFTTAYTKFGRIDVVYNNAGYSVIGEVEETPLELVRSMFEVNFWGAANVSREAVRVFRDVNKPSGGRLLQASSLVGIYGTPVCGFYSASKFALEGLSEALHKELDPSWNIKVTILELGGFRTRAFEPGATVVVPMHPRYKSSTSAIRSLFGTANETFGDSNKAAREIHRIVNDNQAPLHAALGIDSITLMKEKVELLTETLEHSAEWSVDLK